MSFLPGAEPQELSPRLLAQRNRLLENRLLDLQRRNVEIQAEAKEDIRRELQVEIEKERKAAEESAAKVRKDVEVSVEKKARRSRSPRRSRHREPAPGNSGARSEPRSSFAQELAPLLHVALERLAGASCAGNRAVARGTGSSASSPARPSSSRSR